MTGICGNNVRGISTDRAVAGPTPGHGVSEPIFRFAVISTAAHGPSSPAGAFLPGVPVQLRAEIGVSAGRLARWPACARAGAARHLPPASARRYQISLISSPISAQRFWCWSTAAVIENNCGQLFNRHISYPVPPVLPYFVPQAHLWPGETGAACWCRTQNYCAAGAQASA